MPTDCISYQNSGYFTPIINDYLNQKPELRDLYHRFPTLENFEEQLQEKSASYSQKTRQVLVSALEQQYKKISLSIATEKNISAMKDSKTFTITTGHQLNLFTGPLYFLYKIISTLNLTKTLKSKYPDYNFVPVYWMATEDHDFEEINYFNFKGKKFRWNRDSSGAVGRLSTEGLEQVLQIFSLEAGHGKNALRLRELFEKSYLDHDNLADATRYLANEIFGEYGLVIIDADNPTLKREFTPFIKAELLEQKAFKNVSETISKFGNYDVQVNPREINLFYLNENLRERIIYEDEKYIIHNTSRSFSRQEMLDELEQHPEKFSPNVITRPLFQEVILPNLCYIGGGGEIAYWLELKSYFDSVKIPFPILLLRNSVLLVTEKQAKKADSLGLSWAELFMKREDLTNKKIKVLSEFPISLESQREALKKQFSDLFEIAKKTDKSFAGAVRAQEAKQLKGLDNLEKRLLKAQKRKHSDELERITNLKDALFPYGSLQERQTNFSEFYDQSGDALVERLVASLNPLDQKFDIFIF